MPMGYEQIKPPQNNLNAPNSGRTKLQSEDFLIYDVAGDGQCFFHALSLAIAGNSSQSLVYRSLVCSEIYNNFDFYEDQLKLGHHSNISRHAYLYKMVHGNQWATSTESDISVASRILQSNINIWLQGRDAHSNICFTKEEYINSSLSRNVDLLLHLNHFKLLITNSNEQNGFQFYSKSIAIQQKSNEDSFSKLNKIYKNKISKGKKHEKRKQPQEKSSTSGKKIKLTKSNTNVEQKNPTQKNMHGIIPNDIEIPISIIVKYLSKFYIRSFKRYIFYKIFFWKQSSVTHSKRDNSSQINKLKKKFKKYLKKIIHSLLMPPSKHYRTSSFKQVACLILLP